MILSLPPANEVCEGNVFTGVCLSTGGGHAWLGCAWSGGMHDRGACMAGGTHDRGRAWQERQPLQRAVRPLLECILILIDRYKACHGTYCFVSISSFLLFYKFSSWINISLFLAKIFVCYGLRRLGMLHYCNMDYVSVIVICDIGAIPSNDAYQQYMSTGQV